MNTKKPYSKNLFSYQKLASDLKSLCVKYANDYLEDDFLESEFGEIFIKKTQENKTEQQFLLKEHNWVQQMDNYILYGETEDGERVLNQIIANNKLNSKEKNILEDWKKRAFNSIFKINEVSIEKIKATDVLAEVDYSIYFNDLSKGREIVKKISVGNYAITNILPVKNTWFFSGAQIILPKESDKAVFQTYVLNASARQIFRNNPKKIQSAFKIQKEHYDVFVEMFGADELIVQPEQVQEKLQKYYDKLCARSGTDKRIPASDLLSDFETAETVGIIVDEYEGQYEFKNYGEFVKIFKTGKTTKKARELIMDYLEDEDIPAFIFRRMKERYPINFPKVMLETTMRADRRIYPVNDFDKLMNIFKPEWKEIYPSILPMNEIYEKYYYNLKRNDPCYCDSGKKFKKCCGK